jgi:SAM-dependent methyltransferase
MTTLRATEVQLSSEVERTSDDIRLRYRENRNWRLYPKEWIYKNISVAGKDVLDFGCGAGEIATQLVFLGAKRVYAIDVTQGLLDATRRRAELDDVADHIQTICGTVQQLEPRPVDVIIAFAVLHHCTPLENVVPWLLRWLNPGGLFVTVEPVVYMSAVDWMRNHSGIPNDPLDEGERKLNAAELAYVVSHLHDPRVVHFHVLGRLSRILPSADRLWRRADQLLLRVPMMWKLAGTALVVGRR